MANNPVEQTRRRQARLDYAAARRRVVWRFIVKDRAISLLIWAAAHFHIRCKPIIGDDIL